MSADSERAILVERLVAAVGKAAWSQASCSGVKGADIVTFLVYRRYVTAFETRPVKVPERLLGWKTGQHRRAGQTEDRENSQRAVKQLTATDLVLARSTATIYALLHPARRARLCRRGAARHILRTHKPSCVTGPVVWCMRACVSPY